MLAGAAAPKPATFFLPMATAADANAELSLTTRAHPEAFPYARRTLLALQLTFGIEDIRSVAADAVTDGPDDKSCDVVYVDRVAGRTIIAQEYESAPVPGITSDGGYCAPQSQFWCREGRLSRPGDPRPAPIAAWHGAQP